MARGQKAGETIVNIIVHGDTITVSPSIIRATVGEVVRWQAPAADSFVLVFRDGAAVAGGKRTKAASPYGRGVEVRSIEGDVRVDPWILELLRPEDVKGKGPVAEATISGTVGVHQYQLAVVKKGKAYLDVGCPEVIID